MAYKMNQRRCYARDPETGLTKVALDKIVTAANDIDPDYLFDDDHETNPGGFDLDGWARRNDPSCLRASGGIANPTSMAAFCKVSKGTVENRILPRLLECGSLHALRHSRHVIYIAGRAALEVAARELEEQRRRAQSEGGRRNRDNLLVGAPTSDETPASYGEAQTTLWKLLN